MSAFRNTNYYIAKLNVYIECVGIIAFVFMMLLTTVDVIGAKIFLYPIPGALDIMELAQLVALSFALGASYIARRHVEVEFFTPLLPERLQRIVAVVIKFFVFTLFVLMTWRMFVYGFDLKTYTEVSPTIRLPLYPFAYAATIAFIPATLASLAKFYQSIVEVFKP
jgi:TRAP-type C4-dicarboxylate transport system permease small subunit